MKQPKTKPFDPTAPYFQDASTRSLGEIARYFFLLGCTAFGGPASHLAMMEQELVHRRRWLDREHFLDLLAAINFIPGPNSTEMAIALGRLRGGWRGMFIAGACFIAPAVIIILPIAWLYLNYQQLPQAQGILRGIGATVIAIIAVAAWRLGKTAVTGTFTAVTAVLATLAQCVVHRFQWQYGDVCILAAAAAIGVLRAAPRRDTSTKCLVFALPISAAGAAAVSGPVLMALLFLKIGATLFGSGYVLATYLQSSFVDQHHWLTPRQLLDSIAVGQITPGPLLTTATFIGFIVAHNIFCGGWRMEIACAIIATAAIFAPAFILIWILGSSIERLRKNPVIRTALGAMNAAVVGLIAATCLTMLAQSLQQPGRWSSAAITAASLIAMLWLNINATGLILLAGIAGWLCLR